MELDDMLQTSAGNDAIGGLAETLASVVGEKNVLGGEEVVDLASGWSELGTPLALVRPAGTEEIVACLRACQAARIPIVAWGGRTGLVGGACADGAIAISLERMSRVVEIDRDDATMIVEAGCTIEAAGEAAAREGLLFPLDLGSRGSATIGGTISTNAGGNRVLRFGTMRDMVLGLEVVLADGVVLSSMRPLIKNNTAYDLKQLFIGSEGTLGIVTRAAIRLRQAFRSRNAALVSADSFADLVRLLRHVEAGLGGQLSAFEAMWPDFYELVTGPLARNRPILPHGHAIYALVEAMGNDSDSDRAQFEQVLVEALEAGFASNAIMAQSQRELADMWAVREDGEQLSQLSPYVALDISLRVSRIAEFVSSLGGLIERNWPGIGKAIFGHVGDGNLHVMIGPVGGAYSSDRITRAVLELTAELGGSISAEHGIGLDKRDYLHLTRSRPEIEAMWAIKGALDPNGLMNPGKTLPPLDSLPEGGR